jgi:hypothetical protein
LLIKAYNTVINTAHFPVFFTEGDSLIFHGFNKEGVNVQYDSSHIATRAMDRLVQSLANGGVNLLNLDVEFNCIGVTAYKMADNQVPPSAQENNHGEDYPGGPPF